MSPAASDDVSLDQMLEQFVELYCELCRVNRRIGIWDMRRHEVCKAPVDSIDTEYLVKTERLGRASVERRAVVKTEIDVLFSRIAVLAAQQRP